MRLFIVVFCIFMVAGCPKKPKNEPEMLELELIEGLEELWGELDEDNFDDLPEDTAEDEY
tara:strand:+ start:318 stop:497 length:180 start_codon:yes stop_codon:yes gene_type:complete